MEHVHVRTSNGHLLLQDVAIIICSIFIAVYIARSDILVNILTSSKEYELFGSFIAGIFFTSIFTTAPAIVTLGEIAQSNSLLWTALLGGAGAVIGDLIIFKFIKDRFSEHLIELAREEGLLKKFKKVIKSKILRRSSLFVGGLVIASPLPDELGISILGFSHLRTSVFMLISYIFNFVGILAIGFIARTLI